MKLFLLFALGAFCVNGAAQKSEQLLAGTYTARGSHGIYTIAFDAVAGTGAVIDSVKAINPSFLAATASGKYVYAVNETGNAAGGGTISAYRNTGGRLQFINRVSSSGDDPCHISLDESGRHAFVSNYSSGSVGFYGTAPDGGISEPLSSYGHTGSGPDKARQQSPHVHAAVLAPDGRYVLTTDLGTDQILAYRFNGKKNLLEPTGKSIRLAGGSGPRHLVFSKSGKQVYLVEEMAGKVAAMNYHNGALQVFQEISLLADSTQGGASADIHISPDGRFLYASNRQPTNTITIFSIDAKTGTLTQTGIVSSGGLVPRNFTIHSSGKWLLAANQESNNIRIFSVDIQSGMITDTGRDINVNMPVCLVWLSAVR